MDAIERYKQTYLTTLKEHLKVDFPKGNYLKEDVIKIADIALDFFEGVFKKTFSDITATNFLMELLRCSSALYAIANNDLSGSVINPSKRADFAMRRRSVKIILGEFTKVKITSSKIMEQKEVKDVMSKLISIVDLMYEYAHYKYSKYGCDEYIYGICISDNEIIPYQVHPLFTEVLNKIKTINPSEFNKTAKLDGVQQEEMFAYGLFNCFDGKRLNMFRVIQDQEGVYDFWEEYCELKSSDESDFIDGFILRGEAIPSIKELVCKPRNRNRCFFKPFLALNIDGEECLISMPSLVKETFAETTNHSVVYNNYPEEWGSNKKFKNWRKSQNNNPQYWLEDKTEDKLKTTSLPYRRNIEEINGISLRKNITPEDNVGEIDFIIISSTHKCILVVDCKNMQRQTEMTSWAMDTDKFINHSNPAKGYNGKLQKKADWISRHKEDLSKDFIKRKIIMEDISSYEVKALFVIDTPTIYQYNSLIPIVRIEELIRYIENNRIEPLIIEHQNITCKIPYPVFRNIIEGNYQ